MTLPEAVTSVMPLARKASLASIVTLYPLVFVTKQGCLNIFVSMHYTLVWLITRC